MVLIRMIRQSAPLALIFSLACGSSDSDPGETPPQPVNSIPGTDLELEAADGENHGEASGIAIVGLMTLEEGQSGLVRAEAIFPDDYRIDVTEQTYFQVETPEIISISARTADGVPVNAIAAGDGELSVLLGELNGSVTITVTPPPLPPGLDVLGNFSHDVNNVVVTTIATRGDRLSIPRDLEFHPDRANELWVINRGDESMVVLTGVGTGDQQARYYQVPSGGHFMAQPSSLAMGDNGNLATIHETDDFTQGPPPRGTPRDFMGPTLHSSALNEFDGGHGGHLDMLHNSPLGMGIAWERDNVYWVFDGYHSSITRYDFMEDHGLGGSDHTDGVVSRWAEGQVSRVPDVPSHMEVDHQTNLLYISDTGNGRIAVMDISDNVGSRGAPIMPNYDGTGNDQFRMLGTNTVTLVDGNDFDMLSPSGLALQGDLIFVSDNSTSIIWAFNKMGEVVDWLDTGLQPGSLAGIDLDSSGNLYVVDMINADVLRISPRQ